MIAIFSVFLQPINRDRTSRGRVTAGDVMCCIRDPQKTAADFFDSGCASLCESVYRTNSGLSRRITAHRSRENRVVVRAVVGGFC